LATISGKVDYSRLKSSNSSMSGREMAQAAGVTIISSRHESASAAAFWRPGLNSTEKSQPKSLLTQVC